MHAFLVIGTDIEKIKQEKDKLAKTFLAKVMPYEILKIDDVRNLNKFLRLSVSEKTLITINDIHKASVEALNSFLKNLEEPQENIAFALSAPSLRSLLPTIVSRCQIIKVKAAKKEFQNESKIKQFLNLNLEKKIEFFDIIKDRNEAIEFVEELIGYLHQQKEFNNMEILLQTLSRLKRNANVNLQLTNLAIKYG